MKLELAAKAAKVFCNKCGYMGDSEPTHIQPMTGKECGYSARKTMWCDPATILELCALLEKAEAALEHVTPIVDKYGSTWLPCRSNNVKEALAAIKQWKEKA